MVFDKKNCIITNNTLVFIFSGNMSSDHTQKVYTHDISTTSIILLSVTAILLIACFTYICYLINIKKFTRQTSNMKEFELSYNSTTPLPFNQTNCVICLEDFENGEILYNLSCEHAFHRNCMSTYLLENETCPVCREKISV